jgi:hypothetical protein
MPSAFPGMSPYLEHSDVWHDFHKHLIPALAAALTAQLRPTHIVRIRPRISGLEGEADQPVIVVREGGALQQASDDFERESFLEVRDRSSDRVIAVIEVLSPANKNPGPDREQYLGKRGQILRSAVHFVEIDLLRIGPRMPIQNVPPCDYCVMVSKWEARPQVGIWPVRLREQLPTIPIPLSAPHADATLDLQAALHRVYDAAGYEDYIYRREPVPALAGDDAAWAASFTPERQ